LEQYVNYSDVGYACIEAVGSIDAMSLCEVFSSVSLLSLSRIAHW